MSTVLSLEETFHWTHDVVAQHAQVSGENETDVAPRFVDSFGAVLTSNR